MLVVSSTSSNKQKIYHRLGCRYAKRIKSENRFEMNSVQAQKRQYQKCQYCEGLFGDVRIHKKTIQNWEEKYQMQITYKKATDTLYICTDIGFWKIYSNRESEEYLLYHRNHYVKEMDFQEAESGDFHRQVDVKPTESLQKLVEYINAHDRAKGTIMCDYRKLPQSTKKQKKYYKAAKKKARKKEIQRVQDLFVMLEASGSGKLS